MAKTQDFTAMFKDVMGAFPVDNKAMEDAFKTQSALTEKMSAVAIDAAQKSTALSAKWANDTLTKLSTVSAAKAEPADYAKSMTDFASAAAEAAAEHMAAFAEIAKKVQTETLELMMSAGKTMTEDMTAAAKKAGEEMTAVAKKATAAAK
ncbi:MAG: Phasin [Rhodobacteraceae bacterium]|nr:Phasin [Paracoccaceae bacterium]